MVGRCLQLRFLKCPLIAESVNISSINHSELRLLLTNFNYHKSALNPMKPTFSYGFLWFSYGFLILGAPPCRCFPMVSLGFPERGLFPRRLGLRARWSRSKFRATRERREPRSSSTSSRKGDVSGICWSNSGIFIMGL